MHKATFLIGHFFWHFGTGFQLIFYSWVLAGPLNIPPAEYGWYQAAAQVPTLLFLLPAGYFLDRVSARWILVVTLGYAVLALTSAFAVMTFGIFDAGWALAYILVAYSMTAFVLPGREKVLASLSTGNVIQNASHMSTAEYCGRLVGMLSASLLAQMTIPQMFLLIGVGIGLSAISFWAISSGRDLREPKLEMQLESLGDSLASSAMGFRHVLADNRTVAALSFQAISGLVGIGGFIVFVPLTMRQNFGADPIFLSVFAAVVWAATILASSFIGRFVKSLNWVMSAQCLSILFLGMAIFFLVNSATTVATVAAAIFWGLSAGLSLTVNRIVIHSRVNPVEIARAGSLFHFSLLAFVPLGASIFGVSIDRFGLVDSGVWLGVALCFYAFLYFSVAAFSSGLFSIAKQKD